MAVWHITWEREAEVTVEAETYMEAIEKAMNTDFDSKTDWEIVNAAEVLDGRDF